MSAAAAMKLASDGRAALAFIRGGPVTCPEADLLRRAADRIRRGWLTGAWQASYGMSASREVVMPDGSIDEEPCEPTDPCARRWNVAGAIEAELGQCSRRIVTFVASRLAWPLGIRDGAAGSLSRWETGEKLAGKTGHDVARELEQLAAILESA